MIVNETLAQRFFPGEDPIGKRMRYGDADSQAPWMTIVGVVADTRRTGFDAAVRPETYLPHAQAPARTLQLLVTHHRSSRRRVDSRAARDPAIARPRGAAPRPAADRRTWSPT